MRDNKNWLLVLLLLSFLLSILTVFVVAEGGVPAVSAKSSVLYEPTTNDFLLENNSKEKLPMASTTKIMTALLAIELCDPNEAVIIPREATGIEGSSIYLKPDDEITVNDLIYSVLLQSANDAATALAIKISGDIYSFADLMNKRAHELGLTDTSFRNPHGLDEEEHYTTARDLAILSAAALENDAFRKICSTYKHTFSVSGSQRVIFNHNKLLKRYTGAIGVKTGFTDKSGRCLVSAAEKDGVRLIAVTLDAPNDWSDHTKMLDYGFDKFESIPIEMVAPTEYILPVSNGLRYSIKATVDNNAQSIIRRIDSPAPTVSISFKENLVAPIKEGEKLGEISIKSDEANVRVIDIVAAESIDRFNEKFNLLDYIKELFLAKQWKR